MNVLPIRVDPVSVHVAMELVVFPFEIMMPIVINASVMIIHHHWIAIVWHHRSIDVQCNHVIMINNALMFIRIITHVFVPIVQQVFLSEETRFFSQRNLNSFSWLDNQYIAAFHSSSYIKRPPLQPIEHSGRFTIEIWFLSESSSGRNSLFIEYVQ